MPQFTMFQKFSDAAHEMDLEEGIAFVSAIAVYGVYEMDLLMDNLSGEALGAYKLAKSDVDSSIESSKNGSKGGRPKKNAETDKPIKTNDTSRKPTPREKFKPPSVDEVRAYAKEKGLALDPEQFCDFYGSKGWVVGNAPMKDWKLAANNWSRRELQADPNATTQSVYDSAW